MDRFKVIIIGAGLGGLTLAHSLHQKKIKYEIYDKCPAGFMREEGMAITLHWILPHLRKIIPKSETALEHISVSAGAGQRDQFAFYNGYTREMLSSGSATDLDFIRANRSRLLTWLEEGVDINWGKTYVRHEVVYGKVKVSFADGTSAEGHVLVGCDGPNSKVRDIIYQPVPPKLKVLPMSVIGGSVILNPIQYARQSILSRSLYVAHATDFRLVVSLNSYAPDISWAEYHWLLCYADETAGNPRSWARSATGERQLAFARNTVRNVHYDLCEIIYLTKPERMFKPFVVHDRVPEICPAGPVTLIGDAAHPMSFFNSDGGNAAMEDAIELAERLHLATWARSPYNEALRTYEEEMVARVGEMVIQARQAATSMSCP